MTAAADLHALTRQVRACFNRLKAVADALHRDLGITASMRAVIESVAEGGAQTVPQIARSKGVSRQHIQVNTDALVRDGLAAFLDNPAHRRSPLVTLTPAGQAAFEEMRRREAAVLERLADEFQPGALATASATLENLAASLDRLEMEDPDHDRT